MFFFFLQPLQYYQIFTLFFSAATASTRFSPPTKLHEICALFPRNVIQGTNNRWSLGRGRKKSFFLRPTKNKREIIELPTSMDHERRRMRVDTRPSIAGKITRLIVYMKQNN
jgi:hypothetical protein